MKGKIEGAIGDSTTKNNAVNKCFFSHQKARIRGLSVLGSDDTGTDAHRGYYLKHTVTSST
jgi:peptide subunit release factor 1 (eRF1)